tara:strand:+ start:217 stop:1077 length:861 start_codon:yes stop_codon:yes gene_type:complete
MTEIENKINTKEPELLEVKVHPHLVGAVQTNVDCEGKKRFIPSTLVNMYNPPCKPEDAPPITAELAYESIADRVAAVGMFSSRFVNTDEFTRVYYHDSEQEKLECHMIENAETLDFYYPHDRLCCHVDNEWMFKCFQMMFWHNHGLFPHKYTNLPTVINIKRSSGEVQKGIVNINDAIRLRVGSKDKEKQVYIKVHFSCNNPDATDSIECGYTKLIYFQDFLEVNPEFRFLSIRFPKDVLEGIDMTEEVRNKVVVKALGNYKSWFSTELIPRLEKFKELSLEIIQP